MVLISRNGCVLFLPVCMDLSFCFFLLYCKFCFVGPHGTGWDASRRRLHDGQQSSQQVELWGVRWEHPSGDAIYDVAGVSIGARACRKYSLDCRLHVFPVDRVVNVDSFPANDRNRALSLMLRVEGDTVRRSWLVMDPFRARAFLSWSIIYYE